MHDQSTMPETSTEVLESYAHKLFENAGEIVERFSEQNKAARDKALREKAIANKTAAATTR